MAWELVSSKFLKEIAELGEEELLWDAFLFGKPRKGGAGWEGKGSLPVDIMETENEIIINAEIPGLNPQDIAISLTGSLLIIKGEKKEEKEIERGSYHFQERHYGSFSRTIQLPNKVQSEKVSASYHNGILKIALPKLGKGKKKEVKIKIE